MNHTTAVAIIRHDGAATLMLAKRVLYHPKRDPCGPSKEPYITIKETHIFYQRDPCGPPKEPYITLNVTHMAPKRDLLSLLLRSGSPKEPYDTCKRAL